MSATKQPLGPAAFLTFRSCIACLTSSLLIMSAGPSTDPETIQLIKKVTNYSDREIKFSKDLFKLCESILQEEKVFWCEML